MWSPQRQEGNTRIVGPAYTVQYVLKGTQHPTNQGHYVCTSFSFAFIVMCQMSTADFCEIDSVPAGSVIFISSPKTVNAVYGGLMSHRAQISGAVGTVVDGRVRDLQEHRGLGYPVSGHQTYHLYMLIIIGICPRCGNCSTL
jgi:regulator of RNase E activity RraA